MQFSAPSLATRRPLYGVAATLLLGVGLVWIAAGLAMGVEVASLAPGGLSTLLAFPPLLAWRAAVAADRRNGHAGDPAPRPILAAPGGTGPPPRTIDRAGLLDAVLLTMGQGVAVFDQDRRLLLGNDRYFELLGLPTELKRPGTHVDDIVDHQCRQGEFGAEEAQADHRRWIQSVDCGKPLAYQRRRPTGECLAFRWDPLPGVGFVVLISDITERCNFETELANKAARFREMFTCHSAIMLLIDPSVGRIIDANDAALSFYGYSRDEFLAHRLSDLKDTSWAIADAPVDQTSGTMVQRHRLADGTVRELEMYVTPIHDKDGGALSFAILQDVTDSRRAEEGRHQLFQAVEQSPVSVIIASVSARIEYVNGCFCTLSGYSADELVGQPLSVLDTEGSEAIPPRAWGRVLAGGEWRGELKSRGKDGRLIWEFARMTPIRGPTGQVTRVLQLREDVTERKEMEAELARQATQDALTQLPNRVLALDRLAAGIAQGQRTHTQLALLLVDLDNFKSINETFGHDAGDALLCEAAARICDGLRDGETVARLGGDEFLIILPAVPNAFQVEAVASRILTSFREPFEVMGQEVFATASAGITMHPMDGDTPQVLLSNADVALYRAKHTGRNTYTFFTPELNEIVSDRTRMEGQLRRALEREELTVVFQPIMEIGSGQVVMAEALLRWTSPELGPVSPDRFIPVAEETGLILPIGEWVLREACRQGRRWMDDRSGIQKVAVNVSSRQFLAGGLDDLIASILEETGFPASRLELEVTESLLIDHSDAITKEMQRLKSRGITLTIDDFGTGYSALSYLKRYNFNALKIDRSFVLDVPRDPADVQLIIAIIGMAHGLGLSVVAEGVETPEQLAFLRSCQCDRAQGYLLGRPGPADDIRTGSFVPFDMAAVV